MIDWKTRLQYLNNRTELNCVCGRESGFVIRKRDRYGLSFRFRMCLGCGHVWNSNPPSEEATTEFYRSSDFRTMYFNNESPSDVIRRKTPKAGSETALLRYVNRVSPSGRSIVEWGCSGGWNLVPFRDAGWETEGFDYDRTYVSLGRSILGLNLREIDETRVTLATIQSPDIVLLNHVLEHSRNPVSLLSELLKFCSNQSLLIVGIPLLETIRTWHWKDFFHVAHVHYFSASSFKYVAKQAGFDLVHADIRKGLFTLAPAQVVAAPTYSRLAPLKSTRYLLSGFLEPKYRIFMMIRKLLSVFRLRGPARRLKRIFQG